MLVNQTRQEQGRLLGRYRLHHLLGRGGMGEVWLAEDTELHRQVAAKLLLPVLHSEKEYLQAFHSEAHLVASLDHPHILSIHDYGEIRQGDDIVTYLIMPYLNGGTLHERIETTSGLLPIEVSLRYLSQVASAIDYAHSRGVLHRDVTPSNMLLQDDQLYLSDFGIARLLSTSTYRSRTSAAVGTPAYMAPERIQEKAVPASDLYSLAVIAYQLLTGRLPFEDDEDLSVLLKHIQEPVPAPRQYQPQMSEAAESVLLKALAKRPEARPTSCMEFVTTLNREWWPRRRSRTGDIYDPDATLIAPWNKRALAEYMAQERTSLPVTPDTSVPSTSEVTKRSTLLEEPQTQQDARKHERSLIKRRSFLVGAASAAIFLAGSGVALGSTLYRSYMQVPGPRQLHAGRPVLKLEGFNDIIWNVRWNPRGRYLVTSGDDGMIRVWDLDAQLAKQESALRSISHADASWKIGYQLQMHQLAWSPNGRTLAFLRSLGDWDFGSGDDVVATLDIFHANSTPQLYEDPSSSADRLYYSLAWSPSGQVLAAGTLDDGNVSLWHLGDGAPRGFFKRFVNQDASKEDPISKAFQGYPALCWTRDEKQVLIYFQPYTISSWDVQAGQKTKLLDLPRRSLVLPEQPTQNGIVRFLSFLNSPTNETQFLVSDIDIAVIFDVAQKKILYTLGCSDPETKHSFLLPSYSTSSKLSPQLGTLIWSPDGRYVAGTYLSSLQIFVWDLHNEHPRLDAEGHRLPDLAFGKEHGHRQGAFIVDLAWSPDGRYLASSASDYTVLVWQVDGA